MKENNINEEILKQLDELELKHNTIAHQQESFLRKKELENDDTILKEKKNENKKKYKENTDYESDENDFTINDFSSKKHVGPFVVVDLRELPSGLFYKKNTIIKVRPPKTIEIQNYSMMDEENINDVIEKMDELLSACVHVSVNNEKKNHLYLKESDRLYLLIYLKELGLPGVSPLIVKKTCQCGKEIELEITRKNIKNKSLSDDLIQYFNEDEGAFVFETKNGNVHTIGVPNIGMKRFCREKYLELSKKNKNLNRSFWEFIPYIFPNDIKIDDQDIESLMEEWERIEPEDFIFIKEVIDEINLGIEKLEKTCFCGRSEVASLRFPKGYRSIFSFYGGFRSFLK